MLTRNNPPIICVMGPTACGKTSLAIELAKSLPIEIINVDSAQIYQGMNIGTGKPSTAILKEIPHHLMDFLDPAIPYSAAQFRQDAIRLVQEIQQRNAVPLLVGGTMLYFKILQEGINDLPDRNDVVRANIEEMANQIGWADLHQRLATIDPIRAQNIKPTDTQRIQRALEIIEITGQPMSHWLNQPKKPLDYEFINIGLMPVDSARSVLHQNIADRFDLMINQGLIEEVQSLKARGDLDMSMSSMRSVGYRQVWEYLQREITFDEMREKAIAATRQLAKRQLTWLRRWTQLLSYDFQDTNLQKKVHEIIAKHAFVSQSASRA